MRKKLQKVQGLRIQFTGIFVRFGQKRNYNGYPEKTILLQDIKCITDKKISCDHLWFNLTKQFQKINLKVGDMVRFDARVKDYIKGYMGYRHDDYDENTIEKDYKLNYPTNIRLIRRKKIIIS